MDLTVVILAAGKGTRMRSSLPKVLQPLAGKALVEHVIDTAAQLDPVEIRLVYGYGAEFMKTALADRELGWYLQAEQLGTGHAVKQALPGILDENRVLVLYGDVPLIRVETLRDLVNAAQTADQGDGLALLTVMLDDPSGYGRILRDPRTGAVRRIVEQKDAGAGELKIREGNTGILVARAGRLRGWLDYLDNDNAQGEYYLTDVIEAAAVSGVPVTTIRLSEAAEVEGALKLKEISYIHAEAYAAGELKHGPLALVDAEMPVIAVAPNDDLLDKLKSNLREVRARGGELFVFAHAMSEFDEEPDVHVLKVVDVPNVLAPIVYVVPLQLLSYHVARIKGTDVDQPRNLAKAVTVE